MTNTNRLSMQNIHNINLIRNLADVDTRYRKYVPVLDIGNTFYVLVFKFFVLLAPYACYHIFS